MINEQIEQIELSIDDAKKAIQLSKSLDRLIKNKDFQRVIDTGYLETEAVRLVHLKADFNMQSVENQDFVIRGIDSIGNLRAYFSKIFQKGRGAESALVDHENTREALLAEDLLEGGS